MVHRELQNWYLKEIRGRIRVTDIAFPSAWTQLLKSLQVPVIEGQGEKRIIDWAKVPSRYETHYNLVGNESLITTGLSISPLAGHSELLMDYGYQDPVIGVSVDFFIEHWFKLIAATNFMGTVVITQDGSLFMEFTDDAESLLISNFSIVSSPAAGEVRESRR
jgi:hypothetical protein